MARSGTVLVIAEVAPPRIPTELSIDISPTSGVIPFVVTISGRLIEAETGVGVPYRPIFVYVKFPGEILYEIAAAIETDFMGNWVIPEYVIDREGTYSFYAEFEGDAEYEGC